MSGPLAKPGARRAELEQASVDRQLDLVALGLKGRDYFDRYDSVWQHLEGGLDDSPEFLRATGLVLRIFKQVDEGGIYSIGSEYSEVPKEAGR